MNGRHHEVREALTRATSVLGKVNVARLVELLQVTDTENDLGRRRSEQANAERITERDESNVRLLSTVLELERQNRRLQTALDNMSQGLHMIGADGRLIVSNRRACELAGVPDGTFKPGMTVAQILQAHSAFSTASDDTKRQLMELANTMIQSPIRNESEVENFNGQHLRVQYEPMADGGYVTTFSDITEQRLAQSKIVHLSQHDPLTDLPNRSMLRARLADASHRAERGEPFAVLCLDLDQFKGVNDSLGHPIGDALLKTVAERLVSEVRQTDTVARLGGDEFAIVQTSIDQPKDAIILASRVLGALTLPYDIGGHQVNIGVSIGIAVSPEDGTDPDQLLKCADLALYRAKTDGRGCYRFFEPAMDARMQSRRLLETDLRKALAAKEFEVYYQPLVDVRTRKISGFEALLRWNHPERGMVSPVEFIPLCEEIGLIGPIGEWVLRQACTEATKWPGSTQIAVNVSAKQFRNGSLVHTVGQILNTTGLEPSRLELEITESVMIDNCDAAVAILHQLKALGVRIAMDDFGTGYSSLSYLRSFPFDKIKIDQSFVRDLGQKKDSNAIVRAVTAMCGSLGVTSTAEGVETEEQFSMLIAEQCTEVQGYLFSRPQPAEKIAAIIERLGVTGI